MIATGTNEPVTMFYSTWKRKVIKISEKLVLELLETDRFLVKHVKGDI
ncbi:hypothetical protein Aasi_1525 [Candidatus Amoebophilus asiaticus 5a2]|uniref:Uncharacterized protein n=1 Tax=Amoebophilus asiaticus (strain 5a2) TaxID=452471 RepID=C3L4G4_AMOA5|nr:hypothetical protein Aasi_1525 [Candidatus Amoebophilus asiaticus 5a2]